VLTRIRAVNTVKIRLGYVVGLITAMVLGGATTAVVMASVPDANGIIHACRANNNGSARIIDTANQSCSNSETAVNWNQTGPQGPPGSSGGAVAYAHVVPNTANSWDEQLDAGLTSNVSDFATAQRGGGQALECFTVNAPLKSVMVSNQNNSYNGGGYISDYAISGENKFINLAASVEGFTCPAGTNLVVLATEQPSYYIRFYQ
jgi:hypothetical protein